MITKEELKRVHDARDGHHPHQHEGHDNRETLHRMPEHIRRETHAPPDSEHLTSVKQHPDPKELMDRAGVQNARNRLYTAYFSADLGTLTVAGAIFPGTNGLHLPEEADIGSVYCENNGTVCKIGMVFGSSGSFATAQFAPVNHGAFKKWSLPDGIRSVQFYTNLTDTGLVAVILTTRRWSPSGGTL